MIDLDSSAQMSPAEISDFIQSRRRVEVWTARPDGTMHATSCGFGIHYREVVLAAPRTTSMMVDLRRDPQAMLVFSADPAARRAGEVRIWASVEFPKDPAVDQMLVNAVQERSQLLGSHPIATAPDGSPDDALGSLLVRIRRAVGWKHKRTTLAA